MAGGGGGGGGVTSGHLLPGLGSLGGLRGQGRIQNKGRAGQECVYLAMLSL